MTILSISGIILAIGIIIFVIGFNSDNGGAVLTGGVLMGLSFLIGFIIMGTNCTVRYECISEPIAGHITFPVGVFVYTDNMHTTLSDACSALSIDSSTKLFSIRGINSYGADAVAYYPRYYLDRCMPLDDKEKCNLEVNK